jgi:zinc transporter ZupT
MPASPLAALLFAAFTAAGMLAGVWIVRRFEDWAIRHTGELISFAAGLLVSGALLHLISRSVQLIGAANGLALALVAFLAFYVLEAHFIPHVHARGDSPIDDHHHDHHEHDLGPVVVFGLAIHSVVDGVSVGAGLSAGTVIGSVTAILVVVHKLPVGIAAMSALYHSGFSGRRSAWITAALASVTPVAVIISYFAFRDISDHTLGLLLALAGGSFLYVGAADLLPEGQARGRISNTLTFLLGAILMAVIKLAAH